VEAQTGAPAGAPDFSHKGEAAPALTFPAADGAKLALAGPSAKPRLVNFWATWCAPCVSELPSLHALATRADLAVLPVSEDLGEASAVSAFWHAHRLDGWRTYLDPDNTASGALHMTTLPTTVLYDAKGREVWRVIGHRDWGDAGSAKLLAMAAAR